MKYKTKHESKLFIIICLVSILLAILCMFAFIKFDIPYQSILVFTNVAVVAGILYFIEQLIGTAIIVDNDSVSISRFGIKRRIPIGEIFNLSIENYQRYRRKPLPHTDYRMRMTLNRLHGSDIVLTDNAATHKGLYGFLAGDYCRRPDEEVELYKAFMAIRSRV